MPLTFYPHADDIRQGSINDKLELLMESAERYKALVLDQTIKNNESTQRTPRDLVAAYNWEEIANLLRLVRDLPETNKEEKTKKAAYLTKLSEVYEVLRGAKMPKLEAIRLALVNEATHLRGTTASQVA